MQIRTGGRGVDEFAKHGGARSTNARLPRHGHTGQLDDVFTVVMRFKQFDDVLDLAPLERSFQGNVNPGLINRWLMNRGCPVLVGIQTTFGENTPLIMRRVLQILGQQSGKTLEALVAAPLCFHLLKYMFVFLFFFYPVLVLKGIDFTAGLFLIFAQGSEPNGSIPEAFP